MASILVAGCEREQVRADAIRALAAANSIAALREAIGLRGCLYIYPDKSWVAVYFEWYEGEGDSSHNWYVSLVRDSDGGWFQSDRPFGPYSQLSEIDPRLEKYLADYKAGLKATDPGVSIEYPAVLRELPRERVLHGLTIGPNLAAARKAMIDAGFTKFDPPGLKDPLPKITISDADVTAPTTPATQGP